MELARLVLRQDAGSEADATPTCEGSNSYDGRMGVRISSIFVILVGSTWGRSISFATCHVLCRLLSITSSAPQLHIIYTFHRSYISVTNIHQVPSFPHLPSVRRQSSYRPGPSLWPSTSDPVSSLQRLSFTCLHLLMRLWETLVWSVKRFPQTPTHGPRQ